MTKKSMGYRGRINQNVCTYCGDPIDNASRTIDHLIPESRGGIRANDNKVPSCFKCNNLKDNMDVYEFKKFLERVAALEEKNHKVILDYYKKVKLNCKNIINQSHPRDIKFEDGTKTN